MTHNPLDYYNVMGPDDKLLEIGVDLDGTMAEQIWPQPGIGAPIMKTIEWVREQHELGYRIIIFTSRASSEKKAIKKWCRAYGVPFEEIQCGKPLMRGYVDDKNLFLPWINQK